MNKNCPSSSKYANNIEYICNNLTGRWVKRSGKIGQSLLKVINISNVEIDKDDLNINKGDLKMNKSGLKIDTDELKMETDDYKTDKGNQFAKKKIGIKKKSNIDKSIMGKTVESMNKTQNNNDLNMNKGAELVKKKIGINKKLDMDGQMVDNTDDFINKKANNDLNINKGDEIVRKTAVNKGNQLLEKSMVNEEILKKACNGHAASNKGLNQKELKLEMQKKFPDMAEIIGELTSRTDLEKLCLLLFEKSLGKFINENLYIPNKKKFDNTYKNKYNNDKIRENNSTKNSSSKITRNKNKEIFAHVVSKSTPPPINNNLRISHEATIFDAKRHQIIASTYTGLIIFYDMSDLMIKKIRQIKGTKVTQIAYNEENDIYLLGCDDGHIYSYDPSTDNSFLIYKAAKRILHLISLNKKNFIFGTGTSLISDLYLAELFSSSKAIDIKIPDSENHGCTALFFDKEKNLLYVGSLQGLMFIYRIDKMKQKVSLIQTIQTDNYNTWICSVISIDLLGKEYILTAGNTQGKIQIWDYYKGKMRLIRTFPRVSYYMHDMIYLSKYQVLAINPPYEQKIYFLDLLTGDKIGESMFDNRYNFFSLNSSDLFGIVLNSYPNIIQIIELSQ